MRRPNKVPPKDERRLIEYTSRLETTIEALNGLGVNPGVSAIRPQFGTFLWQLMSGYDHYKSFCDEHTHYYDFATSRCIRKKGK